MATTKCAQAAPVSYPADQDGAEVLRLPAQGSLPGQGALAATEGALARQGRLWDRCAGDRPGDGGVLVLTAEEIRA